MFLFYKIKKNGVNTMDKYFETTVCSQCKNQCKNCRRIRKRINKDGCVHIKCANYERKTNEKSGEYKVETYFLYKFLRATNAENQKKFTKDYSMS